MPCGAALVASRRDAPRREKGHGPGGACARLSMSERPAARAGNDDGEGLRDGILLPGLPAE
eukprot:10103139-Alexandrium_andersonii.AAC.1